MKAMPTRSVGLNKVRVLLGAALLVLAWGIVPSFAHPHGYKVFTNANCTGTAANASKWSDVLASKPPFYWFMNLGEGVTCYRIP